MYRLLFFAFLMFLGLPSMAQETTDVYYNDETGSQLKYCTGEDGTSRYMLVVVNNRYLDDVNHLVIKADLGDRFQTFLNLWDIDRYWTKKKVVLNSSGNFMEPYSDKVCRIYDSSGRCGDLNRKDLKQMLRALKKFSE